MVQGQFCGDCLYMRYGEHVLEAMENLNCYALSVVSFVTAVCAGKQKAGLPMVLFIGRYLVWATSQLHSISYKPGAQNTANEVSAKRSLPFSDMETVSEEFPQFIDKTTEQSI